MRDIGSFYPVLGRYLKILFFLRSFPLKYPLKKSWLLCILLWPALLVQAQHTIEVHHRYYTMWFDTVQSAELAGYYIQTTAHANAQPKMPRTGKFSRFTADPLLEGKVLANDAAYKSWNRAHPDDRRDRGHINPFGAFNFAEDAALESMYYSNTCPQASYFNQHQWQGVEQVVMRMSKGNAHTMPVDSIHVWTGVLIHPDHPKKMNGVFEPDYYWKVIVYKLDGQFFSKAWLGENSVSNTNTNPAAIETELGQLKERIASYYPNLVLDFLPLPSSVECLPEYQACGLFR